MLRGTTLLSKENIGGTFLDVIPMDILNIVKTYIYHKVIFTGDRTSILNADSSLIKHVNVTTGHDVDINTGRDFGPLDVNDDCWIPIDDGVDKMSEILYFCDKNTCSKGICTGTVCGRVVCDRDFYVNDVYYGYEYAILNIDNRLYIGGKLSRLGCTDYARAFISLQMLIDIKWANIVPNNSSLLSTMRIKKVECAHSHIAILTYDGMLYTVQICDEYELYFYNRDLDISILGIGDQHEEAINLIATNVDDVFVGKYHTIYIRKGKLYTFGFNDHGECGVGHNYPVVTPTQISKDNMGNQIKNVIEVYCNYRKTSFRIGTDLYMCGDNTHDCTQYSSKVCVNRPTKINLPGNLEKISMGYYHTCMIIDKQLYIKGSNTEGQLGMNEEVGFIENLTHVKQFENQIVEDIACGLGFTIVKVSGILYGCGENFSRAINITSHCRLFNWTPLDINTLNISPKKILTGARSISYII